jgi:hypothetical protein
MRICVVEVEFDTLTSDIIGVMEQAGAEAIDTAKHPQPTNLGVVVS